MNLNRAVLAAAVGFAVSVAATASTHISAEPARSAQPAAPAKYVAPIKGKAEIEFMYTGPKRDEKTKELVTTFKVKNVSNGAIAGFKLEEYWFDKSGKNMIPGDTKRLRQPILPGQVVTIELRTPFDPKMFTNSYKFSHANGDIKPTKVKKVE